MDIVIPLCGDSLETGDARRPFIVFDEAIELYVVVQPAFAVQAFTVYINDNQLVSLAFDDCFHRHGDANTYVLNSDIFRDYLFRSSIVMNNGHNNSILFKFAYHNTTIATPSPPSHGKNDSDEYLEPFQQVCSWNAHADPALALSSLPTSAPVDLLQFQREYPIYSLLNMRLRNTNLKSNVVLTSLDFQNSKQLAQLIDKYFPANSDYLLTFTTIELYLLDKNNYSNEHSAISPIEPLQLPLTITGTDSYSLIFKLPFVTRTNKLKFKVILEYSLLIHQQRFSINTSWETDMTQKKPLNTSSSATSSSTNLLNTSNLQLNMPTPRLYGGNISRFINNTIINNKLNDVILKFMENDVVVQKGKEFQMVLQIINNSHLPLDLVVYNNNILQQDPATTSTTGQQDGIILLSNDYKIPIILPLETYFVNISFVPILNGFYQNLQGLKLLDLESNELIELGNSISILVI